jgi:hypothetical protein
MLVLMFTQARKGGWILRIAIGLFIIVPLLAVGILHTEAHAGPLGDILSYVTGVPSTGQAQVNYPQYTSTNGYQYQVTYHGPASNQPYQQGQANQYGQYAGNGQTYTSYPNTPQYPQSQTYAAGGNPQYSGAYPRNVQQQAHATYRPALTTRAQSTHSPVAYQQTRPVQTQAAYPYTYTGQQPTAYYNNQYYQQPASQARPNYYSGNQYAYGGSGWNSSGSCLTGST